MNREEWVKTSFQEQDVRVLLKDITGKLPPLNEKERESYIQGGMHYSQLLPKEHAPSERYLSLYEKALENHAGITARAVMRLGDLIWKEKEGQPVLVSLARAGTPIGVLLKRYMKKRYGTDVPHYSISIVRDRGLDKVAMEYILDRHLANDVQFVDGWVGKGTIARELSKFAKDYEGLSPVLGVLADPAGITGLCGTTCDFLIPSSCLNAIVSGLFSRTVLNDELIGPSDFHGAVYYDDLVDMDRTYSFIDRIEKGFELKKEAETLEEFADLRNDAPPLQEIEEIARVFGIEDINLIKPGIGETTRVLLRRVPELVLVKDPSESEYVGHILNLCGEKNVEFRQYPLKHYRACGLIKKLTDI